MTDRATQRGLIAWVKRSEFANDQDLFERGEDRLHGGPFQKARRLLVRQPDLAQSRSRSKLAGDGHNDDIGSGRAVSAIAYHDRGPSFGRCLVREREWYEDDLAKIKGHRRRRLPDCSRQRQTQARLPQRRRALTRAPATDRAHSSIAS